MFEIPNFLTKGEDKIKKVAKIGTLAVGMGAGAILGGNEVEAQSSVTDSIVIAEAKKQNEVDKKWLSSPDRYDLSKKDDISGIKKERQIDSEKLLQYNIGLIENELETAKKRIFLNITPSGTEIVEPGEKNLEEQAQEIKEYEQYLINPSLELKKVGNVTFEQEDFENNKESFKFYDQQIEKIAKHLESQEYLDKLILEYGNEEAAKEHQKIRIKNLYNGTYNLTDETPNFSSNRNEFEVQLSKKPSSLVADHEILGHKIVDGDYFSKNASKLLVLSYQKFNPESKYFKSLIKVDNPKDFDDTVRMLDNYFGNKSERFAYKQELEMEMVSLGIKKYGEKFTQDHYQKLINLYHQGKLSADSCRFIETTKPEYFEQIFNEIAEVKKESKKDFYNPDWDYGQPDNQENKT